MLGGYYRTGPMKSESTLIGVAVLNANGVAYQFDTTVPEVDTNTYIANILVNDDIINDPSKDPPIFKGVYSVDVPAIDLSIWNWGESYVVRFVHTGRIVNDTTFVITEVEETNGGPTTEVDLTYRFVPFSPKPDSTSTFIDEG